MKNDLYPLPLDFDTEKYPNTANYIRLYGVNALMSDWELKDGYKSTEEVYGECLKQEVTWQELLNWRQRNILL